MSEIEENTEGQTFKSENFSKKNMEKRSFTGSAFNSCDFSEAAGLLRAFDITLV